ncbi:uncharacterized protein LOC125681560 [Ostrea edulis]|uniref:uncharacterized protein LOC125681560 n=1 Tax=Ostrea edulis TaxID=37623 RepID=UPI0024AF908F|nr:uncharacterized protein LOC125681560 [Ostrea edulis]
MLCFVTGCNHQSLRETCSFYRFPRKSLKQWEKLCRRKDRTVTSSDRICSCHFKDGRKEKGPTLFPWNQGTYFDFQDPNTISRHQSRQADPCTEEETETAVTCNDREPLTTNETVDLEYTYMRSYTSLVQEIKGLEKQIAELQTEISYLQSKKHPVTVAKIMENEKKMMMYTSLKPEIFSIIDTTLQRFPLVYVDGWTPSAFSRSDQLFMTLMKLKLNCPLLDLAERFCTSKATVHNIFITHVFALHEVFFVGMMENNMPSLLKCKSSMPSSFGDFSCCRLVIDATEVTQDVPGQDMAAQSQTYSSYKNRHTVKAVTGVAPNGAVVYVSKLYPGSTSDVAIVEHSNMLAKLSPGDMILADKGFTIYSLLPQGVHLNIPPFLKDKGQYTPAEVQVCRKIARSRIHVERVNERIKKFEILSHIPQQFRHISTKIFQVCSMLVNFQDPMIAEIADNYTSNQ